MAALPEQLFGMGLLEIPGADLGGRDLRSNAEHRHARAMAIEQPVDQVKVSGSAAAGADGEFTGEMGLGAGCEGGDFLMPDMNPFDLALAAQRVGDPMLRAVADDAQ